MHELKNSLTRSWRAFLQPMRETSSVVCCGVKASIVRVTSGALFPSYSSSEGRVGKRLRRREETGLVPVLLTRPDEEKRPDPTHAPRRHTKRRILLLHPVVITNGRSSFCTPPSYRAADRTVACCTPRPPNLPQRSHSPRNRLHGDRYRTCVSARCPCWAKPRGTVLPQTMRKRLAI